MQFIILILLIEVCICFIILRMDMNYEAKLKERDKQKGQAEEILVLLYHTTGQCGNHANEHPLSHCPPTGG